MLALSMCPPSGSPSIVPSPVDVTVGAVQRLGLHRVDRFEVARRVVNPMGAASRWSWKLFTKKNTCAPFCCRFVLHELAVSGAHEQGNALVQGVVVDGNIVNG